MTPCCANPDHLWLSTGERQDVHGDEYARRDLARAVAWTVLIGCFVLAVAGTAVALAVA